MKVAVITTEKITKKFAGIKLSVFDWKNSNPDDINLRDFDGVIIDIDSYAKLEDKSSVDRQGFETKVFSPKVVSDVLTEGDSFFVVLGRPTEQLKQNTLSTSLGFTLREIRGNGDSISPSKWAKSTVYASYLSKIKNYTYSFEGLPQLDDYYSRTFKLNHQNYHIISAVTSLLITRAKYQVAFTVTPMTYREDGYGHVSDKTDVFKGPLAFLPVLPSGSKQSIEAILEKYSADMPAEAPEWAEKIKAVGQTEIDEDIQTIKETIASEQTKLDDALTKRANARKPIEVLYLSDKPLENALKTSFDLAGFKVGEPKNTNNVEFYLQCGTHEFVTEVKSTEKATFNKDGIRQVNEWRENELLDTGKEYKPLLILSNQYLTEPSERNVDFIDENLIAFAESRKIAIVSAVVLYDAFQMLSVGIITADNLSKLLYDNSGIVTKETVNALAVKDNVAEKSKA
jgi:hypothetical protein